MAGVGRQACLWGTVLLVCAFAGVVAAQQRPSVDGDWRLETNPDVRLVLTRRGGSLQGEFTTLDGVFRFPVSEGSPGEIRFSFKREDEGIGFLFTLRLSQEGRSLSGPGDWTMWNGQKGTIPWVLIRPQ